MAIPPLTEASGTKALDAAFVVHRELGPGLLESVYEKCLCHQLSLENVKHRAQVELPISFRGLAIEAGLRLDLLVEDSVVIELKAVERLLPIHEAQLLTYMKLSGLRLGFLLNFNTPMLRDGIKRMVL